MAKSFSGPEFTDHIAEALKRAAAKAEPGLRRSGWMALLADDIGAGDTTIKNWVYAENPPPGDALLILFAHLGDEFLNDVLSVIDRRAVPIASAEVDATALKADLDRGIGIIQGVRHEIDRAIEHGGGPPPEVVRRAGDEREKVA